MAFAITNLAAYVDPKLIGLDVPGNKATGGPAGASGSEADATVTNGIYNSGIQDFGVKLNNFRAVVYLKTSAGTSSIGVSLQVSNSATFATATDIYTLDTQYIDIALTTQQACFTLFGMAPVNTGFRYARIHVSTGSGTSGTADYIYYAF